MGREEWWRKKGGGIERKRERKEIRKKGWRCREKKGGNREVGMEKEERKRKLEDLRFLFLLIRGGGG